MIEGGIPHPLLSDAGGRVGTQIGIYDENNGVDLRGRFITGLDFVLRAVESLTPEIGCDDSELIRQVKAFQHVAKTGELTPSGWQPGKKTLKPRPTSAGNVWKEWMPEEAFD